MINRQVPLLLLRALKIDLATSFGINTVSFPPENSPFPLSDFLRVSVR